MISVTVIAGGLAGWYFRSSNAAYQKQSVQLAASTNTITLPCAPGTRSDSCPATIPTTVQLAATITNFDKNPLYSYTVTGGRVSGGGSSVSWDLSGLAPGSYTAVVEVSDRKKHIVTASTVVSIVKCPDCMPITLCPSITVSCSDSVKAGTNAVFTAAVSQGSDLLSYNWTVSAGEITEGQGTSQIKVSTKGIGGQTITATVEVSAEPGCGKTSSCSTAVK